MFKLLGRRSAARHQDDGFLKMAQVEYRAEYRWLCKSLGREPTGDEMRMVLNNLG